MKSFQERTEIIRGMIAQRMRQSPCSEDISFTTLQTWPELLIWGFPEGMIFNIIVSCDLELKKGYDLQQAIQAVESNEESQPHEFPDRHLINYIKYRLQKEYPQYVYLYNDSLLYSLKTSVEKGKMCIRDSPSYSSMRGWHKGTSLPISFPDYPVPRQQPPCWARYRCSSYRL